MNTAFEFKTLAEFHNHFRDEQTCIDHFTAARFAGGEFCPHCHHSVIYKFSGGKRYRCAGCRQDFTIKTGTIFGESKLPLRKWFLAIHLLTTSGKGISSIQLAKQVGVTQKTAWFMSHRIREANQQDTAKLDGVVEADETYVGGKAKNMHARKRRELFKGTDRGTANKMPVFGVKSRNGKVRAQVIKAVDSPVIHQVVKQHVAKGATLYTDEHRAYNGLGRDYQRGIVRHGAGEYVRGEVTTNGIESFWAILKRGYNGIYHWMSGKHLHRYLNEFTFRFNLRMEKMKTVFSSMMGRVADSHWLPYKTLIQEPA